MTFIHYIDRLKTRKEIYFKFYESPHKVEVKDKEDAVNYLEAFYQEQKDRLDSFKKDLDLFANSK